MDEERDSDNDSGKSPSIKRRSLLRLSTSSDSGSYFSSAEDIEIEDPSLEYIHITHHGHQKEGQETHHKQQGRTSISHVLLPGHERTSSFSDTSSLRLRRASFIEREEDDLQAGPRRVAIEKLKSSEVQPTSRVGKEDSQWESWWVRSPHWKRKIFSYLVILTAICVVQLISALAFFSSRIFHDIRDPRECSTRNCRELFNWMNASAANNWDYYGPCQDLYEFTCRNHKLVDIGEVGNHWTLNFARLETDGENGESLVVRMLNLDSRFANHNNNSLEAKVIKFYQTCMKMWYCDPCIVGQPSTHLNLPESMRRVITLVTQPFSDNITKVPRNPWELYESVAKAISLFGDASLFLVQPPYVQGKIALAVDPSVAHIRPETVSHFLPMIWNALLPPDLQSNKYLLFKLKIHLWKLADTFTSLMVYQRPSCTEQEAQIYHPQVYFDLETPFIMAYYRDIFPDNIDNSSTPEPKLRLKVYPGGDGQLLYYYPNSPHFNTFQNCWNHLMSEQFKGNESIYFTPTFMTSISLRVLTELINHADQKTAQDYKLGNPLNMFTNAFRRNFYKRTQESRCFTSLIDTMGHYPSISYFQRFYNIKEERNAQLKLVRSAATALLKQFRPAEEGGLSFVSQFIREIVYQFFNKYEQGGTVNVIIPLTEEDPLKDDGGELHIPVTDNYIENLITWRLHLFKKSVNYWHLTEARKFGKFGWHRVSYTVDKASGYFTPNNIFNIKFPASIFVFPYWRNDILVADYAGAFTLALKTWMAVIEANYFPIYLEEIVDTHFFKNRSFFHGSTTDDIHINKSCHILTYAWPYPPDDYEVQWGTQIKPKLSFIENPHLLAFRTEYQRTNNAQYNFAVEVRAAIFPHWISIKTALEQFEEDVNQNGRNHSDFTPSFIQSSKEQQRKIVFSKLHDGKYKIFNEKQLFFLLYFRQICRSKDITSVEYWDHVIHNQASIMHSQKFRDAFSCPPHSPLAPNPICFPE